MVKTHKTLLSILLIAAPILLHAQQFDLKDTVTEYPMKGTFYHNKFEGRKTSCGEIFNQNLFTAAHKSIKMGTFVKVTNRNNGLSVIVKVNDRCPKRGVMDMTRRAAYAIGIKGCQPVTVRILPEGHEQEWLAQDSRFDSVYSKFASGKQPADNSGKTGSSNKQGKDVAKKNTKEKTGIPAATKFNILLGTARTHGEAFEMISLLPVQYQDKTVLDSTSTLDGITVTLEVMLSKPKARELNRALKHTFHDAKIVPSE